MTFRQFMELMNKLDEMTKLMDEIVKLLEKPKTNWALYGDIAPKWDGENTNDKIFPFEDYYDHKCYLCENGTVHMTHQYAEED